MGDSVGTGYGLHIMPKPGNRKKHIVYIRIVNRVKKYVWILTTKKKAVKIDTNFPI